MTLQYKQELEPKEILDQAISQGITDFYVAYSGGKDSGIVLDIVAKNYPDNFRGVVFVNTGIATDATVSFVMDYCSKRAYPLYVLKPENVVRKNGIPFSYENLVMTYGFPRQAFHTITMRQLKYYPLRKFIADRIRHDEKPAIIGGIRKNESSRRKIKWKKYLYNDDKMWFVSPLFFKSNDWVYQYFIENNILRSPVYNTLHISGDCLCGCFADKSELKLLQMFHPEVYDKITYLENKIKSEGSDDAKKNATWGKYHQATNDIKAQTTIESYLCSDCILDRSATDDDTKRFNDEFENIEAKLDKL